jgi:hypothetical protein
MIETGHFAELDNILRLTLRQYQLVVWLYLNCPNDGGAARISTTPPWKMSQQPILRKMRYRPLSSLPPSAKTFSGTSKNVRNPVRAARTQNR